MSYFTRLLKENFCIIFYLLAGPDQKKLLTKLFENYDHLERPSLKDSESLKVELGLSIQQIVEVDEKKQTIISSGWLDMVMSY